MPVLLISYDLNAEVRRPNIVKAIKEISGLWAKLSESSYAVSTTTTAQNVYAELSQHIDSDDQIYIIPMRKPYAGFGPNEVHEWLDANLTY